MTKLIHQTDLFHPHGDPDDHFDLSVLYALSEKKLLELDLIVMDYPPPHRVGDPAVVAVQQLDYLAGRQTPAVVGTPHRMISRTDCQETAKSRELAAAERITELLRGAKELEESAIMDGGFLQPVYLHGENLPPSSAPLYRHPVCVLLGGTLERLV